MIGENKYIDKLTKRILVGCFTFVLLSCAHSPNRVYTSKYGKEPDEQHDLIEIRNDLYKFAGDGNPEKVRSLISSDHNHVIRSKDLNEALFYAVSSGSTDTVKVLISAGADINVKREDTAGYTPLMELAINGEPEQMASELIELGADVNLVNVYGRSALFYAVHYGHFKMVKILVAKGAQINLQTLNGSTPLMEGVVRGLIVDDEIRIVHFLIDHGADVNIKDKEGHTALYYAKKNQDEGIVSLLRKTGDVYENQNKEILNLLIHAGAKE